MRFWGPTFISGLISLSFIFCASQLFAEATSPRKIYVVDMERVLTESVAGKAVKNTMQEEVKRSEITLGKLKRDVLNLREELSKQSALLSAEALEKRQEELRRSEKLATRKLQDAREELNRKNHQEMGKVIKEIDQIITELGDGDEFPVIVEKDPRFVLFANEEIDLTSRVIEELDKKKLAL